MGTEAERQSPPSDAEVARLKERAIAKLAWVGIHLVLAYATWAKGAHGLAALCAFCAGFEIACALTRIDRWIDADLRRTQWLGLR